MTTTALGQDDDSLRRIADALERIADRYSPRLNREPLTDVRPSITIRGNYAATKDDLAKAVTAAIRDQINRGSLPKPDAA